MFDDLLLLLFSFDFVDTHTHATATRARRLLRAGVECKDHQKDSKERKRPDGNIERHKMCVRQEIGSYVALYRWMRI